MSFCFGQLQIVALSMSSINFCTFKYLYKYHKHIRRGISFKNVNFVSWKNVKSYILSKKDNTLTLQFIEKINEQDSVSLNISDWDITFEDLEKALANQKSLLNYLLRNDIFILNGIGI